MDYVLLAQCLCVLSALQWANAIYVLKMPNILTQQQLVKVVSVLRNFIDQTDNVLPVQQVALIALML